MNEYRPLSASDENEVEMKINGSESHTERPRGNFKEKDNEYYVHLIYTELNSEKKK